MKIIILIKFIILFPTLVFCQIGFYSGANSKEIKDITNHYVKKINKNINDTNKCKFLDGYIYNDNDSTQCKLFSWAGSVFVIAKFNNDSLKVLTAKEITRYKTKYFAYCRYKKDNHFVFLAECQNGKVTTYLLEPVPFEDYYLYFMKFKDSLETYVLNPYKQILVKESQYFGIHLKPLTKNLNNDDFKKFISRLPNINDSLKQKIENGFYDLFAIDNLISEYNNNSKDSILSKQNDSIVLERKTHIKTINDVFLDFNYKIGIGAGYSLGNSNKYLTYQYGFFVSVSFAFKGIRLHAQILGYDWGAKTKREFTLNDSIIKKDIKIESAIPEISLGYAIINKPYHRLVPSIGYTQMISKIFTPDTILLQDKGNIVIGLSWEFKKKEYRQSDIIITPLINEDRYGFYNFSIFAIPYKFNNTLKGVFVCFQIGVGVGNRYSRKYRIPKKI